MKLKNIDKEKFMHLYDLGLSDLQIASHLDCAEKSVKGLRRRNGLINKHQRRSKHSEETKAKMSLAKKKWLQDNPEKHTWKKSRKHISQPCEFVKSFLKQNNVSFVEEFSPEIEGRFFSVDIAFPDKMIALEINGNQHYEKNGELKFYYQERHKLLEQAGWIVYEVHYSACFNLAKWSEFIKKISESETKIDFDYFSYKPREKSNYNKCSCGNLKWFQSPHCRPCYLNLRSSRPTQEELENIIWTMPSSKISKIYNVSDTTIKKWCRYYGITKPPRGYWEKIKMVRPIGLEPTC